GDQPPTLAMMGTPSSASRGRSSAAKRSRPGLARPIELTIPDGVSAIRGGGFPSRGWSVTVLVTNAETPSVPETRASSVPDPFTNGDGSRTPQNVVSSDGTARLHHRALDTQPLPAPVDLDRAPVAGSEAAGHGGLQGELACHAVL